MQKPICFVVYAHGAPQEEERVIQWVRFLEGIDVEVRYDLEHPVAGASITKMMEDGVADAHRIFAMCSPRYKTRFDAREGGVGYEAEMLAWRLMSNPADPSVIPVLLSGTPESSLPRALAGRQTIDIRDGIDRRAESEAQVAIFGAPSPSDMHHRPRGVASVPPRPSVIVGRDEALTQLRAMVGVRSARGTIRALTAVRGLPGIGKTALATLLARDELLWSEFPDGVVWASVGERPRIDTIVADLANLLGAQSVLREPDPTSMVSELRRFLEGRRVLFVLDDVWADEDVSPLLRLRPETSVAVITTRLPSVARSVATPDATYEVPALSPDSALELFATLAPRALEIDPTGVRDLAARLEYLPLALHVAAGLLRAEIDSGLDVRALCESLEKDEAFLDSTVPHGEAGVPSTLGALLSKSTARLSASTRDHFAALRWLPPGVTFDREDLSALWDVDDVRPTVRELTSAGLLEAVELGAFRLHPVLRTQAIRLGAAGEHARD